MSYLPDDDKARKMLPLLKQILYFPKALREMTKVSVVNNVRYNPGRDPADINWARGKSTDQLGSAFRHIMERLAGGKVFEEVPPEIAKLTGIERVYVLAELTWRSAAALELEIEAQEALEAKEADTAAIESPFPQIPGYWYRNESPARDSKFTTCNCGEFTVSISPKAIAWVDKAGKIHGNSNCQ